MKHIAIVGSRSRTDPETVDRLVAGLPRDTIIVSGGAAGPDTWAEKAAQKYGLTVWVFRLIWSLRPHMASAVPPAAQHFVGASDESLLRCGYRRSSDRIRDQLRKTPIL